MNQKMYLITGLMASGKSTVSELLAESLEKCVHLRGDVFRKMMVSGREDMSDSPSEEAIHQLHLRSPFVSQNFCSHYLLVKKERFWKPFFKN